MCTSVLANKQEMKWVSVMELTNLYKTKQIDRLKKPFHIVIGLFYFFIF
jgi:hypothetical protein